MPPLNRRLAPGRLAAAAALALAAAASARAATFNLPESARDRSWGEQQRIRYYSTAPMKLAQDAIGRRDDETAERALKELMSIDPDSNYAREHLIEIYSRAGRADEAIRLCDELTARYPDYVPGHLTKGFLALRMNRDDDAIQSFEAVLRHAPGDYERRGDVASSLAQLYYLRRDYPKAVQHGSEWLRRTNSREANMFLAECAAQEERWADALPYLDQALLLTTDRAMRGRIQLERGYALSNVGRFDGAEAALLEAKATLPDRAQRLRIEYQLGLNAYNQKKFEKASSHFKAYLLEQFNEDVARSYLYSLGSSGQWELARVEARALLKESGLSDAFRKYALDYIMRASEKLGDITGYFVAAQQLYKVTGDPRYILESATAAEKLGQPDEALRLYRAFLDTSVDATVALNYHYLLKPRGDRAESERVLLLAIEDKAAKPAIRHAALYELAQVYREAGREADYFRLMEDLVAAKPGARFYHEYAVQLYGAGRHEQALEMFRKSLAGEKDTEKKFETSKIIADLLMILKRPAEARDVLNEALAYGSPDRQWSLSMSRVDYAMENHQACIDRLLPLAEGCDVCQLYIGFSFYKLGMPGLALTHLNRIADPGALAAEERFNLHANRAYLHFDQDLDAAALADLDAALALEPSEQLELVRLKTLTRLGRYDDAIRIGSGILDASEKELLKREALQVLRDHPDHQFRDRVLARLKGRDAGFESDVSQTIGLCHFRKGDMKKAIELFSRALDFDQANAEVYYLRGLAHFREKDFKKAEDDFLSFYSKTEETGGVPFAYWGDVGVLAGEMADYDFGTAALDHSTHVYPYDVDSVEETGYQLLKWNKNDEAKEAFARAIDIYNEILPNLSGEEAVEYEDNLRSMKKEFTKLDKTWGAQAYVSRTEFDADTEGEVPLQTIEGALPSQAGIYGSYRPPDIGFRNEKTLDVFGRVLANFEDDSWSLDEESYQGGIGVVYKPFARLNVNTSFERLFKIGDDAEDNWLWRNLASWERGERPMKGRTAWPSAKAYGELSYFLDEPDRWIYFLDGRAGLTLSLADKVLLTLPQGIGIARYQSDDPAGTGTYAMYGVGGSLRIYEPERDYLTERLYLDIFAHYVWGEFDDKPEGFENPDFEGFIVGVSLVK